MFRDQDRVIRDDPEMSADLFRRLPPHIPSRMGNFVLVGLNERPRMYRYRSVSDWRLTWIIGIVQVILR
jgi:hypothetical protein